MIAALTIATVIGLLPAYLLLKLGFATKYALFGGCLIGLDCLMFLLLCRYYLPSWASELQFEAWPVAKEKNLPVCWHLGQDLIHLSNGELFKPVCGEILEVPRASDFARAVSRGKSRICLRCAKIILKKEDNDARSLKLLD